MTAKRTTRKTRRNSTGEKKDVYAIVTEKIMAALDKGVVPWRKSWRSAGASLPVSSTGKPYRGVNVFLLSFAAQTAGYTSPVWMTYDKASELGGQVRKGEKSTLVVFWNILKKRNTDPDTMDRKPMVKIPLLRFYTVFNTEQIDGKMKLPKKLQAMIDAAAMDEDKGTIFNNDAAKAIADNYQDGPKIVHRAGAQASYSPMTDTVTLARQQDFDPEEEYYSTEFHEFGHSTGHRDRLNRNGISNFSHKGDDMYAEEELVAEMTAAILCAVAGVDSQTFDNSMAYINGWRKRLTDDHRLVVGAAAKAQRAADRILGTVFEEAEEGVTA